jgi:hypothetical protein
MTAPACLPLFVTPKREEKDDEADPVPPGRPSIIHKHLTKGEIQQRIVRGLEPGDGLSGWPAARVVGFPTSSSTELTGVVSAWAVTISATISATEASATAVTFSAAEASAAAASITVAVSAAEASATTAPVTVAVSASEASASISAAEAATKTAAAAISAASASKPASGVKPAFAERLGSIQGILLCRIQGTASVEVNITHSREAESARYSHGNGGRDRPTPAEFRPAVQERNVLLAQATSLSEGRHVGLGLGLTIDDPHSGGYLAQGRSQASWYLGLLRHIQLSGFQRFVAGNRQATESSSCLCDLSLSDEDPALAFLVGSAGPADTVDVLFLCWWETDLDHMRDVGEMHSTSCNIGRE